MEADCGFACPAERIVVPLLRWPGDRDLLLWVASGSNPGGAALALFSEIPGDHGRTGFVAP